VQLPEAELFAALDALKAASARILSVAQSSQRWRNISCTWWKPTGAGERR